MTTSSKWSDRPLPPKWVAAFVLATSCAPSSVVWHNHDFRVIERGARQRVVRAGDHALEPHDAIGVETVTYTGGHVAYAARDGHVWRVYVDGLERGGSWDGVGAVAMSSDGDDMAYAAERSKRWFVVHGSAVAEYDGIVAFGFDGHRLVYAARRDGAARLYVDGEPAPRRWRDMRDVSISPLSYVASDESGEHFVRGAEVSEGFDSIVETTDDGFVARDEHGHRVAFAFGKRVGTGEIHHLATAAQHFIYSHLDPRGEIVVHDGQEDSARFTTIEAVSLSPSGEHYGYVGQLAKGEAVVVDGHEVGRFTWARAPTFAKSGAYAFVASMGAGAFVQAPRGRTAFDVVIEDSLVLTEDGAHWAVVAGYDSVRRPYLVIDGKPRASFDIDDFLAGTSASRRADTGARLRERLREELVEQAHARSDK